MAIMPPSRSSHENRGLAYMFVGQGTFLYIVADFGVVQNAVNTTAHALAVG
jgi:hypothetical protein